MSTLPQDAPGGDLRRRVSRLLLLRTLVVSFVLVLSLWLAVTGEPEQGGGGGVWMQSLLLSATYASSIVFGVLLRRGFAPRRVARPMQATDLVVTSLLVYVTGGAQSPYTFLYALSIVAAGALSYRRGAVVVTIASIAAFTLIAVMAWAGVLGLPMSAQAHPADQTAVGLIRTLGINYAALIGVGALAFIFGDQLQRGAQAVADLYTLHQDIVRSLASGLITIDSAGTVLAANGAAGEILRRPPSEMLGKPIADVMPGLPEGAARRADIEIDDVTIGVTVSPLKDVRDQVIGRIVNFQDLTELRRLELQTRLQERLVTVGQLAAGIAHEIRNPLASISGSIELLKAGPAASEEDRTLMSIVHREIARLDVLIGDLLDYANPKPQRAVDFDLGVLVEETLQVARGDQAFGDVEVTAEVDKPLPINADPAKLRQVLWNLVRNAADAASSGGKHVRVSARGESGVATITVADDGPGIPAAQIERIFDPFFTTKRTGTGLGLATSHAVIAEHAGRIDVESEVGKGTKMVVTVPRGR